MAQGCYKDSYSRPLYYSPRSWPRETIGKRLRPLVKFLTSFFKISIIAKHHKNTL
jgi:hypothetical protein